LEYDLICVEVIWGVNYLLRRVGGVKYLLSRVFDP
jgi:hypothetical protein